jgi:hypothetical protein
MHSIPQKERFMNLIELQQTCGEGYASYCMFFLLSRYLLLPFQKQDLSAISRQNFTNRMK